MLVTLYPGASRDDVLKTLREIESAAHNTNSHSGFHGSPAYSHLTSYLEWTTNSVRMLDHRVSAADIDRLVRTRGYERLVSAAGSLTGADIGTQRVLNGFVDQEIQQRIESLQEVIKDLDGQVRRWNAGSLFTVADTSFYIEHEQKLRELDFAAVLQITARIPIRVLVPIVVIDELDRLKTRGSTDHARWRAGHTLGVLDEILRNPRQPGQLTADVTMEIVFDPPAHIRLPINDDEIVDRAVAIQALAGTNVRLLTFDTRMSTRARYAGLNVVKLTKPLGEEPTDKRSKRKTSTVGAGHPDRN
jgi:rRNA-processing protein FCF1